jgi:hypothetical protein
LPDGAIATSELKKLAPQVSWEKTAYVQINYGKSGIRTTADNAYVKKFTEVEQNKSDFFEHLLANEERSPGISNRMLVGVPTADKKNQSRQQAQWPRFATHPFLMHGWMN